MEVINYASSSFKPNVRKQASASILFFNLTGFRKIYFYAYAQFTDEKNKKGHIKWDNVNFVEKTVKT